jgi:hypothetical protein
MKKGVSMPFRVALPVAARRLSWLGCVLVVALAGCVEVKQIGGNPCDPDPCTAQKGVCGGWKGVCSVDGNLAKCGSWSWTSKTVKVPNDSKGKPLTAPLGYNKADTTCDALDNDCDGRTDEEATATAASCPAVGVCAGKVASGAICLSGKWKCDFAADPAFEASETTCDGQDNDCDGQTDENVVPKATDCKRQGVCASLGEPVCTAGAWDCGYSAATDFEEAETKCDGKDNDCDGIADASLAVTGLACLSKGACSAGVVQVCAGGVATCDYGKVTAFQAIEAACDGIDNDCDGQTDNLAGTSLPLVGTETTGCADKGVCGQFKTAVSKTCQGGVLTCSYSAVPGYESSESSCDGKDNDCDGAVDNGVPAPSKSPCGNLGVCGLGTVTCIGGLFACDYTALAAKGYEAFEQSCDGKDNDCDGQTDETSSPAASKCKTSGVCAFGTDVKCAAGKASCDYSHVQGYEEGTETTCDGQDNDCDGLTDEAEALDASKSGCATGVCAGKAGVSCAAGKWACDTSKVAGFEAVEKTCDGLDNDCDGLTDEGLSDPVAAGCSTVGVCSKGVPAACIAGKYLCNAQVVVGYEAAEKTCDGLDNDCDGQTDIGVCATGAACTSNSQCASSNCATLLDGSGKVCADKAGQCAYIGGDGKIAFVASGAGACSSGTSVATCNSGTFSAAAACPSSAPSCNAGACGVCPPNALSCDPSDKTKVVQCSADGKSFTAASTCSAGQRCAGAGQCVIDGVFAASDTPASSTPVGVALPGGFALAWLSDGAGTAEVRVRLFGSDGKAKGSSTVIGALKPAKQGSRLAIAPVGSGFGLAWTTAGNGSDIAMQLFGSNGAPTGSPIIANGNDLDGIQTDPAMASGSSGFVVTWTSDSIEGTGDLGIAVQRFDLVGQPLGNVILGNVDDGSENSTPNQTSSAVAMRSSGEFALVWTHVGLGTVKDRVRGRLFAATGDATGTVLTFNATSSPANQPAITLGQNEFVIAWAAGSVDPSGLGIAVRHIDLAFKSPGATVAANTITEADQDRPWLSSLPGGITLLLWRSAGAVSVDNGTEISERDLAPTQGFSSDETVLTKSSPAGDQDQPRAFVLPDGRAVYLWRGKPPSAPNGEVEAMFR